MNPYYELTEIRRNGIQYVTIYVHCSTLATADVAYTRNRLLLRKLLHTIYNVYCILSSMLKCVGV